MANETSSEDPDPTVIVCEECGSHIPPDSPFGMCPKCMIGGGMGLDVFDDEDDDAAGEPVLDTIGPYALIEHIGEGGFGDVFRAEQHEPVKRDVALKIIKRGMDTRQVIARFDAEKQALALMDHPNIARVYDAGETEDGRPYFVMELAKGKAITEFCDRNALDLRARLKLFLKVCAGVRHAHQKGIIHRDLKPSNLLVVQESGEAQPKIIDFGIAKATQHFLTDKTIYTEANQLIGTPEYMSPEQAATGGKDIDTRSDVFSLGVVLYELLTGSKPFSRTDIAVQSYDEIIKKVREHDPPRPSKRLTTLLEKRDPEAGPAPVRRIRNDLDWIIVKAMEKDRNRRYESVGDLVSDLENYLTDEPVTARPPSRIYIASKFVRKHRTVVVAGLAIASALVAGTIVSVQFALEKNLESEKATAAQREGEEARRREQKKAADSEYNQAELLLGSDRPTEAAARLAGALNIYPSHQEAAVRLMTTLTQHNFPRLTAPPLEHERQVNSLSVSEDGKYLGTASDDGHARVFELATGREIASYEHRFGQKRTMPLRHAAVTADGSKVASIADGDHRIHLWNTASGEVTFFDHESDIEQVGFFKKDELLISCSRDKRLVIWNLETGKEQMRCSHENPVSMFSVSAESNVVATASSRRITIWEVSGDGFHRQRTLNNPTTITQLALSPDGMRVISAGTKSTAWVWDLGNEENSEPKALQHGDPVQSLALSPCGARAITGSKDGNARIWDLLSGELLVTMSLRSRKPVYDVGFSPDGTRVFTVGGYTSPGDITARVWDAASGSPLTVPIPHRRDVLGGVFTPDSQTLITASRDSRVRLWDIRPRAAFPMELTHSGPVWHAGFSEDGKKVITWANSGGGRLWDAVTGMGETATRITDSAPLSIPTAGAGSTLHQGISTTKHFLWFDHPASEQSFERYRKMFPMRYGIGTPFTAAVSADGAILATGGGDRKLRIWNLAEQSLLFAPRIFPAAICRLAFNVDASHIIVGLQNGEIAKVKALTGDLIWKTRPSGVNSSITCLAISPKRSSGPALIAAGDNAGRMFLLDSETHKLKNKSPQCHGSQITHLAFSPDGFTIVSGSRDNTARIASARNGESKLPRLIHSTEATKYSLLVAVTPDGKYVITGGNREPVVRVWDIQTGAQVHSKLTHASQITSLLVSKDSSILATACNDGAVYLWNLKNGRPICAPFEHGGSINSMAFNPSGDRLVTSSDDGKARIFDLPPLNTNIPGWLPEFAECYVGQRVTGSSGTPEMLSQQELTEGILRFAPSADSVPSDDFRHWAGWLASDPFHRSLSPKVSLRMENHLGSILARGTEEGFRTALTVAPSNAGAMSGLALSIATSSQPPSLARLKEAETLARKALLAAGEDRDVIRNCAEVLGYAGRLDEALLMNAQLLASYPEDTRLWFSRGILESLSGNIYGAAHAFGEAESIAREDEDQVMIKRAQDQLFEIYWGKNLTREQVAFIDSLAPVETPVTRSGLTRVGRITAKIFKTARDKDAVSALEETSLGLKEFPANPHLWLLYAGLLEQLAAEEELAKDHSRSLELCISALTIVDASVTPPRRMLGLVNRIARQEVELGKRARASILIPRNATWSYRSARGAAATDNWHKLDYDDGAWEKGAAQFGYGEGDETTNLNEISSEGYKLRHVFSLKEQKEWKTLMLELHRGAAVAVFINGEKMVEENIPRKAPAKLTYETRRKEISMDPDYVVYSLPVNLLRQGENIISVELRPFPKNSPTLNFDLQLIGAAPSINQILTSVKFDNVLGDLALPDAPRHILRASFSARRDDLAAALVDLDKAIAANPDCHQFYMLRSGLFFRRAEEGGSLLQSIQDLAEAEKSLDTAVATAEKAKDEALHYVYLKARWQYHTMASSMIESQLSKLGRLPEFLRQSLRRSAERVLLQHDSSRQKDFLALHRIPPRPQNAAHRFIDLTNYYNSSLDVAFHTGWYSTDYSLKRLPHGIHKLDDGVTYDMRGIIQLQIPHAPHIHRDRYPKSISLDVDVSATKLHFLHGMGWDERIGREAARFTMHYEDGTSSQRPIIYGQDAWNWVLFTEEMKFWKDDKPARPVWVGRTTEEERGTRGALYSTVWENPYPNKRIKKITFLRRSNRAAPFLIAITADPQVEKEPGTSNRGEQAE